MKERVKYKHQATFSETQWHALTNVALEEKTPVTQVIRNAVTLYLRMREANTEGERK